MKNQNDLIFSIVAVVLAIIVAAVFWATQPDPPAANSVAAINVAKAGLPPGSVTMANSLPGGGGGGGGGGAGPAKGGIDQGPAGFGPGGGPSTSGKRPPGAGPSAQSQSMTLGK